MPRFNFLNKLLSCEIFTKQASKICNFRKNIQKLKREKRNKRLILCNFFRAHNRSLYLLGVNRTSRERQSHYPRSDCSESKQMIFLQNYSSSFCGSCNRRRLLFLPPSCLLHRGNFAENYTVNTGQVQGHSQIQTRIRIFQTRMINFRSKADKKNGTKMHSQTQFIFGDTWGGPLQMVVVQCHYSPCGRDTGLKLVVNKISYVHQKTFGTFQNYFHFLISF